MKNILKIFILFIVILNTNKIYAQNTETIDTESILKQQQEEIRHYRIY